MPHDVPDPRPWEAPSSRYVSRKPWLTLRQYHVRPPNGTMIEEYNVFEYPDWVNVVAVAPDGRIVLVRQYRHGVRACIQVHSADLDEVRRIRSSGGVVQAVHAAPLWQFLFLRRG